MDSTAGTAGVGEDRPPAMRTLVVLTLAALTYAVNQTSLLPAVPGLIKEFHISASTAAWTFTGYLLAAGVLTPVLGRLGDMFGRRRLLIVALIIFALGNVLSAVAGSFAMLVVGRVIQSFSGGVYPLAFGIIRDEFPADRVRGSIGFVSAAAGVGSGIGLVAGGLLMDHASFRWIFWMGAAAAALATLLVRWLVPDSPRRSPGRVDVRGAAVFAVGLVLPLVAATQADSWGWTGARTLLVIAAGIVVLVLWVFLERATAQPLANLASLSHAPVLMTNAVTVLIGFGMFGLFLLVPQLVQAPTSTGYGFGDSATGAGLLIVPGSVMMLLMGPVSAILADRLGSRIPLTIGGLLTGAGVLALAEAHGTRLDVILFATVGLTGVGLSYAAMPNLIIDAVPTAETGEATGFNAVMRLIGASLGGQVCASILSSSAHGAGAFPTDVSFRTAFIISAAMGIVGAVLALLIPKVRRSAGGHLSVLEEVGAAAPGVPTAYGID